MAYGWRFLDGGRMPKPMRPDIQLHVEKIRQARSQSELLVIEAYCRSTECSAREVRIRVKDHDETLVADVEREGFGLTCPVCGKRLAVHWIRDFQTDEEDRDRDARARVNMQMYARDQRNRGDNLVVFPSHVICDERLPPTPDGWFD